MKKIEISAVLISFVLILLLLPAVQAQSPERINIIFDIQPDMSVHETNVFFFPSAATGNVNYSLGSSVKDIEVFGDSGRLDYRVAGNDIVISSPAPTKSITIKYTADGIVFTSDSVRYFFAEFSFERPTALDVQLKLPEGYGIYQDSYRPPATIASDGRRVILLWNETAQSIFFSAKFVPLSQGNSLLLAVVVILAAAILIVYFYYRERTREEFMKGFREDEKRTIEYLQQRKVALQSDFQKEFKFSRAKATRIVKILEEKGLVRKQRYGRTNKLLWLR